MDVLKVTIADDSEFMRMALKRILETQERLEIVGLASDGEEAVNQVRALKPNVAILDIKMPKISGIEAAHQKEHAEGEGDGRVGWHIRGYHGHEVFPSRHQRRTRGPGILAKRASGAGSQP